MIRKKKKGSAVFIVVMLMSVILILSFSLIPLTLTNLKQSNMLYGRNRTYYTGEGTMDKMLHYIDVFSEKARISAYKECFTSNGSPNLNNIYVNNIYKKYIPEDDLSPELTYEEFEKMLINYYKHEFNIRVNAFFNSNVEGDVIKLLEGDISKKDAKVLYTWDKVKDKIEGNSEKVEALQRITDKDNEFYRFRPKKSDSSQSDENYLKEFSNINFKKLDLNELNKVSKEGINILNDIYEDFTLRETFYVKSKDEKETERYASVTIDFDPIARDKALKKEGNQTKQHDALKNYAVITEDNLIAGNKLTINSSVIVGGEGKSDEAITTNVIEYGGIIAGLDDELNKSIPKNTSNMREIGKATGSITINGDAFVGELDDEGNIHGGFIETASADSSIDITGNSYAHSVVTHEDSSNGRIDIGKSAFVADNVSLNGTNNNINITNNLIGFEDGSRVNKGYLSSPSIVINKIDKEEDGKLSIGKQVALAGEGFVESLVTKYNDNDVLFKTFETTAIYPNYIAYSNYLNSEKFNEFYKEYSHVDKVDSEEIMPIDMLDKYSIMSSSIANKELFGIEFILSYLTEYKDEINNEYDMGKKSLTAENIKIDSELDSKFMGNMDTHKGDLSKVENNNKDKNLEKVDLPERTNINEVANEINGEGIPDESGNKSLGLNLSYFNYVMYANGNMYLTRKPEDTLLQTAGEAITGVDSNSKIITSGDKYSVTTEGGKLSSIVFPTIKDTLSKRLMLEDVVKYSTFKQNEKYSEFKDKRRLDRCFDWSKIDSGDININNEDMFVKISKGDIILSPDEIATINNKKTIFIASEGDVVINSTSNTNISGCIVSKGNLITKGKDMNISNKEGVSSIIANYKNEKLQEFLSPGLYLEGEKDMVTGLTRTVKTNIDIVNKRQILD